MASTSSCTPGEIVGLVGESGSGKSVTGFSLVQLIDAPGEIVSGDVLFKGEDLRRGPRGAPAALCGGDRIAMIFQDPLMTLNPVLTIGEQMGEAISSTARAAGKRPWQRPRAPCRGSASPHPRRA